MIFRLLRIQQWYKNLVIFLPLVFVGLATDISAIILTSLGFFALCLISSANYILNDLVDKEYDYHHSEKRLRPIASGKIGIWSAGFISMALATSSLILGFVLAEKFFAMILFLFILTTSYTLLLKKEIFLDIIIISTNFVLRAVSGAYILDVRVSPWLILCTFFLAFFIVVGKRRADSYILKNRAFLHKPVLQYYTLPITNILLIIATTLLIVSYALYSFLSIYPHLIYTIPFSLYVILRYYYLIESKSDIARKPEKFYKDIPLILGTFVWVIVVFSLIY